MCLSITHHAVDLVFGEAAGGDDGDLLLAPGPLVTCRDIHDTVSIDIEGNLDLRHAAWSRRNTIEDKAAKRAIVLGELALTLQDIDLNAGLVVTGRRENLALLRRDSSVALDQASEDATQGLDTQRKRGHIEQQDIFDITGQHTCLNGGTNSHHFVRVHTTIRLTVKDAPYHDLHCW